MSCARRWMSCWGTQRRMSECFAGWKMEDGGRHCSSFVLRPPSSVFRQTRLDPQAIHWLAPQLASIRLEPQAGVELLRAAARDEPPGSASRQFSRVTSRRVIAILCIALHCFRGMDAVYRARTRDLSAMTTRRNATSRKVPIESGHTQWMSEERSQHIVMLSEAKHLHGIAESALLCVEEAKLRSA